MTLKEKAGAYAVGIRSETYAVGRTREQKMIDGIVAGNAFAAGYRAALRDVGERVNAVEMPNVAIMFMAWLEELEK